MTVAVIDDHPILLNAVKSLILSQNPDYELHTFSDAAQFLEFYLSTERVPDLIITDISMPQLQGVELITTIRSKFPKQKILVLSSHKNERLIQNLFNLKINGYLFKDDASDLILEATQQILENGTYVTPAIRAILNPQSHAPENQLTPREIEIIQLIAKGFLNKEIADQCFISEATVKTHRKNIMHKLELGNTADLVRYAVSNELI